MEEVDAIILQSLREIGCEIEDDVKLKTLTPEEIYKCLKNLCKTIQPDVDIPNHLPVQMAQRFSAASQLVDCCKSLGFQGDLGYQTILYSNVVELRRIFMWLIEHLPKSEDKTDFHESKDVSRTKQIENAIARKLASDMRKPWVLEFLQTPQNKSISPVELEMPKLNHQMSDEQLEYYRKFALPIYRQTSSSSDLLASIILSHDKELYESESSSRDTLKISQSLRSSSVRSNPSSLHLVSSSSKSNVETIREDSSEIVQDEAPVVKPKTRLEILSNKIEELKGRIEDQEDIYRQLSNDKSEHLKLIELENEKLERLKKENKLKSQMAMLLDNPEESIEKLTQSLEALQRKRENLNAKFEVHKKPLDEKLESFSGVNSIKLQKSEAKMNEMKSIRQTVVEIKEDLQNKIKMQQKLHEELSQLRRSTERSSFTERIMDIVKNIKKQNYDIDEILKDTKTIQKAINTAEGQLQRQFTVTEDLIWNNTSKKDEYSKKAYKLLISLHTEFSELVSLIESTGSIQREIRDLEDQIDNERQCNIQQKLDQITKDLEMLSKSQ